MQGWVTGLEPATFRSTGDRKTPPKGPNLPGIFLNLPTSGPVCKRVRALAYACEKPRKFRGLRRVARKKRGRFRSGKPPALRPFAAPQPLNRFPSLPPYPHGSHREQDTARDDV